jgi:hypothetical protein
MHDPLEFVGMFFDLIKYCEVKETFDMKTFKGMHDKYAKKYAKLKQENQGLITEQIYKIYKDAS